MVADDNRRASDNLATRDYPLLCPGVFRAVNMQLTDQRSEAGLLSSDEY